MAAASAELSASSSSASDSFTNALFIILIVAARGPGGMLFAVSCGVMRRPLPNRSLLLAPLVYLVALLLLFEEWCWDLGGRLAARITAWPPLRSLQARVRTPPPYVPLVVFV